MSLKSIRVSIVTVMLLLVVALIGCDSGGPSATPNPNLNSPPPSPTPSTPGKAKPGKNVTTPQTTSPQ